MKHLVAAGGGAAAAVSRGRGSAPALTAAGLLAATALLAACVHYAPEPRPPERIATSFAARSLADPQLQALLARQLPGRTEAWPRASWDRADLLVAMFYFNDSLAAARASARAATAGTRTARQYPNPSVGIMGEYANQHDGSPLWLWAVTTDFLLDVGTRRGARIALADLTAQRAAYELAELAWKQRSVLRRSLAELLITEREVTLREAVHEDRRAQLDMEQRRLEAGAATKSELDRLVSDALHDEEQLHDARRRVSLARSSLAAAVGIPVAALTGLGLSWEGLEDPPELDAASLAHARDDALLERADVHAAVVSYSLAEESLRLEVARQYPEVHLGPAYTWDHGVKRYQFNLGLTLPLFNHNLGAIGEAEARREESGARLEATVDGAWQEADEALRQWRLARERLAEARGPVYDDVQRIYNDTARGFAAGANDRTELVAARIGRTLAEIQLLDAVRIVQEALANLEDALRRPLEGPELALSAALASPPPTTEGVKR